MRALTLNLRPYRLPFVRPLKTHKGIIAARSGVIVTLTSAGGAVGVGDCAPLLGFCDESWTDAARFLVAARARVLDVDWSLETLAEELDTLMLPPSARFGLEQALLDGLAQEAQRPIAALLCDAAPPRGDVPVHALVRDALDAEAAVAAGFSTLKVKVGLSDDRARLEAIRAAVGGAPTLRLDANGAWSTAEEARRALDALTRFGLHSVEQPLKIGASLEALGSITEQTGVLVALDESVRSLDDVRRACERPDCVACVVIKPMFCGGFLRSVAMAAWAAERGVSVSVTTALESAVGRLGTLQLTGALPGEQWSNGLATGHLLSSDLGVTPAASEGAMRLPTRPGLLSAPLSFLSVDLRDERRATLQE